MMVQQFSPGERLAKAPEDTQKSMKETTIRRQAMEFEIAIALGETDIASEMVKLLVELEPTAPTFIVLSQRARHAGIGKWERELASRAASRLSKDEYAKFERGKEGAS